MQKILTGAMAFVSAAALSTTTALASPAATLLRTEYERQQDSLDRAWQEDQAAFQNAMTRWTVLGVADAEVARVLGIPVGTRTTDWQYQQAQMRAMSI